VRKSRKFPPSKILLVAFLLEAFASAFAFSSIVWQEVSVLTLCNAVVILGAGTIQCKEGEANIWLGWIPVCLFMLVAVGLFVMFAVLKYTEGLNNDEEACHESDGGMEEKV
jgi:hypothetical protein